VLTRVFDHTAWAVLMLPAGGVHHAGGGQGEEKAAQQET